MPLIDTALVAQALDALIPAYVRQIIDVGGSPRPSERRLTLTPGILIMPQSTGMMHTGGVSGSAYTVSEQISITIQLYDLSPGDDASPRATLREIRQAIAEQLQELTLADGWGPLRYEGGAMTALDDALWTWTETYAASARCRATPHALT